MYRLLVIHCLLNAVSCYHLGGKHYLKEPQESIDVPLEIDNINLGTEKPFMVVEDNRYKVISERKGKEIDLSKENETTSSRRITTCLDTGYERDCKLLLVKGSFRWVCAIVSTKNCDS